MKFKIHSKNISKVVVDNNSVLKPQFMIIDAFYALEGWELTSRTPVKMNLLVSGKDVVQQMQLRAESWKSTRLKYTTSYKPIKEAWARWTKTR